MIFFLLRKAEQLGLFDKLVNVKGAVRKDGTVVAPHTSIRHVKPSAPKTGDLFDRAAEPGPHLPRADVQAEPRADNVAAAEDREDLADATPAPVSTPREDELDPSSPHYRYRDTGYVAGSRKEMAATIIRRMARKGERVHVTDIDWAELEENPREAKELIVKSNLFGEVDWEEIKTGGMEPGAGFLLAKVYASVGTDPATDTPDGRRDFALAIDTLRSRLEGARTPDALLASLAEMRDERDGAWLNAEEQRLYDGVSKVYREERVKLRDLEGRREELSKRGTALNNELSKHRYEASKREARGWAPKPELQALVGGLQKEADEAWVAAAAFRKEHGLEPIVHREQDATGVTTRFEYPARKDLERARNAMNTIAALARARNQRKNPLTRAWTSLGPSFNAILDYRSHKGSETFGKHVATVKAGRVSDWSWTEKNTPKGASKRSTTFQLHVADHVERVGGREVKADSTSALKDAFNLREVQSGNWVLDDPNSAKFHVEACAGAFADLADMVGAPDEDVSFRGRLAMAFGARGKGGAKAHYEPVHRVINITKMAGAGSLAHEWFHCVDNLVKEATSGVPSDQEDFATENPGSVDHAELSAAFRSLTEAMTSGPHRKMAEMHYSEAEEAWAKHNMSFGMGRVRGDIKSAPHAQGAVDAVDRHYHAGAFGPPDKKKARNSRDSWRKIALIHHGAGGAERKARFETGPGMSSFMLDALDLDQQDPGKYWSQPRELAARAFSSYIEDKLQSAGRKNTYLVVDANNRAYVEHRPFPDGEERARINAAFDHLFELMRKGRVLAKAMEGIAPAA